VLALSLSPPLSLSLSHTFSLSQTHTHTFSLSLSRFLSHTRSLSQAGLQQVIAEGADVNYVSITNASALMGAALGGTTPCRANMAHIRQSRPDSGPGFQVTVLKTFRVVPSSLGRELREHHQRLRPHGRRPRRYQTLLTLPDRFRRKREELKDVKDLCQKGMALTVFYVPHSFDGGITNASALMRAAFGGITTKPETRNSKPETRNSKLEPRNPKLEPRNPRPSGLSTPTDPTLPTRKHWRTACGAKAPAP